MGLSTFINTDSQHTSNGLKRNLLETKKKLSIFSAEAEVTALMINERTETWMVGLF